MANIDLSKENNSYSDLTDACYSRAITSVVSAILSNAGFSNCDPKIISILNEMLQSLLIETGRLSKALAEHSGRTQPILSDLQLALIEMGIDVVSIPEFASKETNKIILLPPLHQAKPPEIKTLKSGPKQQLPYVPEYFPELPDTRTYINTPVQRLDKDEYKVARERDAVEKRDIEKAYTKYLARTGQTYSLFDNKDAFPLIANNPNPNLPAYIPALLGKYSYGPFEELNYNTAENGLPYLPLSIHNDQTIANDNIIQTELSDLNRNLSNSIIRPLGAARQSSHISNRDVVDDVIHDEDSLQPYPSSIQPQRKYLIDSLVEDNPYVRFLEKK